VATRDAYDRMSAEIMSAIVWLISPAAMGVSLDVGLSCMYVGGTCFGNRVNNQIGRKTAARTIGVWRERRLARRMAWLAGQRFVET
jgi:hypothetical protein